MSYLELIYIVPLAVVFLSWIVFAIVLIFRKRSPATVEQKRDRRAISGLVLESIGYAVVWKYHRPTAYLLPLPGVTFDLFIGTVICILAVSSAWMVTAAVKTLGKQWAVAARVVEGHQLITTGPYARVRNPIYSGMFGMLIATGLAWSTWQGILIGGFLFWVGTIIRVKSEEQLLRETFGNEFDDYTRRVPQLIPRIF